MLAKSPIGGAIGYARSNWVALNRYAEAGYPSIDNDAGERAVKPVALGRKNWLFDGGEGGGRSAAILFSLASSCKIPKLDPFAYVRDVLDRVCTHPARLVAECSPIVGRPSMRARARLWPDDRWPPRAEAALDRAGCHPTKMRQSRGFMLD